MLKKVYTYHIHLATFTESHFNSVSLYDLIPNTKFDTFPYFNSVSLYDLIPNTKFDPFPCFFYIC
jgi:hypothetical protein